MHMCGGYKSYRIGQGHLLPVFQCGVKAYTSIGVGYVEVTPWGCQLGLIRTQFLIWVWVVVELNRAGHLLKNHSVFG